MTTATAVSPTQRAPELSGQTVVLIGGSSGIGLETARQLGAQGMTVLIGARDEKRGTEAATELREGGADARFVQLDVTDAASIRQAAD